MRILTSLAIGFAIGLTNPSFAQESSTPKSEFHGDGMRFSLDVRKQIICTGEDNASDKLIVCHVSTEGM